MKATARIPATLALTLLLGTAPAAAGSREKKSDIVDTAVAAGSFGTLVAAVEAAGLVDALKGEGPFTVFAPTDEAFAKLPAGTLESLLEPGSRDRLRAILSYHVVSGALYSRDVRSGRVKTLQGSEVTLTKSSGGIVVDQAKVVAADVTASNGVIHVIDEVILPASMRGSNTAPARELIELAIRRGAPMYNRHQPAACAAIYEVTARGLLGASDWNLPESARARLERALDEIRYNHDPRERAWTLRHALDDVMAALDVMPDPGAMTMSVR